MLIKQLLYLVSIKQATLFIWQAFGNILYVLYVNYGLMPCRYAWLINSENSSSEAYNLTGRKTAIIYLESVDNERDESDVYAIPYLFHWLCFLCITRCTKWQGNDHSYASRDITLKYFQNSVWCEFMTSNERFHNFYCTYYLPNITEKSSVNLKSNLRNVSATC